MNNNAPFVMVPPPWWNTSSSQSQLPPNEVPARVMAAMRFLEAVSAKTADRVAINDHQIQDVPGQKLTPSEGCAHDAACDLLESYFRGNLRPNVWEGVSLDVIVGNSPSDGQVLPCPFCMVPPKKKPDPTCACCKGAGKIMVSPWREEE